MTHRLLRYAILGIRILLPSRAEARYARVIRTSGLFDRSWYLACNPRLPRICRLLPERHYVLVGEGLGLCPSPAFSPRAYLHLNPDLPRTTHPFGHYITTGQPLGRPAHDLPAGAGAPALPRIDPQDHPDPAAATAVVLHLYYREIWEEIAARIAVQSFAPDLFVTLTEDPHSPDAGIRARILAQFPRARIWTLPNHGRDILPFLHLAQSGVLATYAAVCKLHTKKSPHRDDGDAWRGALLDGVLGAPDRTAERLCNFLGETTAGLWVADWHLARGAQWWGPNRARSADLLVRAGLDTHAPNPDASDLHAPYPLRPVPDTPASDLVFAAGSIYWIKSAALAALAVLPVRPGDFEPEMGQVDGTTAHAIERISGLLIMAEGLTLWESRALDLASPPCARE